MLRPYLPPIRRSPVTATENAAGNNLSLFVRTETEEFVVLIYLRLLMLCWQCLWGDDDGSTCGSAAIDGSYDVRDRNLGTYNICSSCTDRGVSIEEDMAKVT